MTAIRRTSVALGCAALLAIGVFLVLEATNQIDGNWRTTLAQGISTVARPNWAGWISGLVGVALALVGIVTLASQFAPAKKGNRRLMEVHETFWGSTQLSGRAARSAVKAQLSEIEGIVESDTRLVSKRLRITVLVDDRVNIQDAETKVREHLDHGFWLDLGVADMPIDILVTHHQSPPRVR